MNLTPEDERIRRLRHDIANPLAAILAETQLMLLDEATLPTEVAGSLREVERMARRIKEILEATR